MTTGQHPEKFLRKRKMLLALPLLVLPFITLGFWALGGGKDTGETSKVTSNDMGLNLQLPNANLKNDRGLDKMSYYDMARADSEKFKARLRNDPYFRLKTSFAGDTTGGADGDYDMDKKGLNGSPYNKKTTGDGEAKVYTRLQQINAALENAKTVSKITTQSKLNESRFAHNRSTVMSTVDKQHVDGLENMMHAMKQDNGGPDSEMMAINTMLDKVMDIQHPERVTEKLKQYSIAQKQQVFAVSQKDDPTAGFFKESNLNETGIDSMDQSVQVPNAIAAVVAQTQILVNGAAVKLRLLNTVYINGILIPKNAFVFGKATLAGERLTVSIASIRYENALLPVALSVYDMDGMEGIYVPGAITREVASQSTDNALQSIALGSLDPSVGAQAASAGIETAKTLIRKKVKLVRVTVKAGYRVLLKDNNNK